MIRFIDKVSAVAIRKPRVTIGIFLIAVIALAVVGRDVKNTMHDSDVILPGTDSAKAVALENKEFGESENIVVLIHGPKADVDHQGPKLAKSLDRIQSVDTISAWSPGAKNILRHGSDNALVIARSKGSIENAIHTTLPQIRKIVDQEISQPAVARISGPPPLAKAIIDQNVEGTKRAELISGPLVLIVLLLVFRSPIAAAIPILLGFSATFAGQGLITLLGGYFKVDSLALSMMSGMGLALGVDYSLLIISRFREELDRGKNSSEAASATVATAGRTVLFTGLLLVVSMLLAFSIAPGTVLGSAIFGIIGATMLAQVMSLIVLPPALKLIGSKIDLWRFQRKKESHWAAQLSKRITGKPAFATILAVLPLLAIAVPATAISFGAPTPDNLPNNNQAKIDFEYLKKTFGLGWANPYEITIVSKHGPITDLKRLDKLRSFQLEIAKLPEVKTVVGPGLVSQPTSDAGETANQLKGSIGRLNKLNEVLGKASSGTGKLSSGISRATAGSDRLASGSRAGATGAASMGNGLDRTASGLILLSNGIEKSGNGTGRIVNALTGTYKGIKQLSAGTDAAEAGAFELARPAQRLASGLSGGSGRIAQLRDAAGDAEIKLQAALDEMEHMKLSSKADPRYRQAYSQLATVQAIISGRDPTTGNFIKERYKGFASALDSIKSQTVSAANGSTRLASGAQKLNRGLNRLNRGISKLKAVTSRLITGSRKIDNGLAQLHSGSSRLHGGTVKLKNGSERLINGLSSIFHGASKLHNGLSQGKENASKLASGMDRISNSTNNILSNSDKKLRDSSAVLSSGYFVLGALDSGPEQIRQVASYLINLDNGGTAIKLTVLPRSYSGGAKKDSLGNKLGSMTDSFKKQLNADAAVGGRGAVMQDYKKRTVEELLPMILVLMASTFLILMVMFRSILIAVKSVILNLLTLGAAMGILSLLFIGNSPLFGGAGYLEVTSFYLLYATIFALSMDYEVFIISRMREHYLATGSNDKAVEYGVDSTAGIITGAVAVMVAIFGAFVFVGIGQWAQFGVGLIAALVIDATVIRLVLLPATMRLLGEANWWLPAWLDRILPNVEVESSRV